jgi:hypothetical protein
MNQFLADQIDQMDLALDQLAMKDRNFDRFALMLIDNVVELVLHTHAKDRAMENAASDRYSPPTTDPKAVASAQGQYFEPKVKLAKLTGMLMDPVAESILHLHNFRNNVYHSGLRHEGILHSLALFYFQQACATLIAYEPMFWAISSYDRIPHRALKYIGKAGILEGRKIFGAAFERLAQVAESMGDSMISDLHADMSKTIESVDDQISFVVENTNPKCTRKDAVLDCQWWTFARSEKGRKHAQDNGIHTYPAIYAWMKINYQCPIKDDPIPSWKNRLASLQRDEDHHQALKKYCDFIKQTDALRTNIRDSAEALEREIQHQIDLARGR